MTVNNKIHILSPQLINQIAAGEVIERPASVVKELVENSLDAGATRIEITLEQGGKQLIQIRDNGHGIAKQDLPFAISSHATSKIHEFSDLEQIASLGFRGEALASISSISRFSIASKAQGADSSWQIKLAGRADQAVVQPCAHPVGTTITVRDLFFNTPARRKFMRTDKTELLHIEELIKRIALSRFKVDLILTHNDKTILNLKAAKNDLQIQKRIAKIYGANFLSQAIEIDEQRVGLRLWGWLGKPEFHRSQNDLQYFYLNGRMVKDRLIGHAIRQAYQDSVFEGRYPAFCLHLECDPKDVDVNVHPTKHEVRFQQARLVHDFIVQSCQPALMTERVTEAATSVYHHPTASQKAIAQTQAFYASTTASRPALEDEQDLTLLKQIAPQYAAIMHEEQLYIVDCLAAQKAILKKTLLSEPVQSQPLLIPETLNLSEAAVQALEQQTISKQLGFDFTILGPTEILLRDIPVCLRSFINKEVLAALFGNIVYHQDRYCALDALLAAIEWPLHGLNRTQCEELLHQMASEASWQSARFCQRIDCEQLFYD